MSQVLIRHDVRPPKAGKANTGDSVARPCILDGLRQGLASHAALIRPPPAPF